MWAVAGNGVQHGVTFLLLIYLAHILSPRDFGLMAAVSIGLDVGIRVARWGLIELLQKPQFRNDDARNQAFRLALGIGAVFMALF